MELGMIGLGRMGGSMARRLLKKGFRVVVYDPVEQVRKAVVKAGATGAGSLDEVVAQLSPPRVIWLMAPSGEPTEGAIRELSGKASAGDTLIDGGNSNYRDSMRQAASLARRGIRFLDVGCSGGIWGLEEGYCLMVGGDYQTYLRLEPVFQALAPAEDKGYGYVGPSGAGHFVKMVHNGIEYGLMEAYAEGFELLLAKKEFDLEPGKVIDIWRYGSVVRSWLLDLTGRALAQYPGLKDVAPYVEDSGEGRWAVAEATELEVPLPVISLSLQMRFRSRQDDSFAARLLAAMRNQFGGHAMKEVEPAETESSRRGDGAKG